MEGDGHIDIGETMPRPGGTMTEEMRVQRSQPGQSVATVKGEGLCRCRRCAGTSADRHMRAAQRAESKPDIAVPYTPRVNGNIKVRACLPASTDNVGCDVL